MVLSCDFLPYGWLVSQSGDGTTNWLTNLLIAYQLKVQPDGRSQDTFIDQGVPLRHF